ncbi:unnamed protein product [Phaedon cochleariae]|uniref:S1 motif domain-containing protein n=1 Tax=Phaedon cochleariae TaxID=80249 RepID=A0A9N9SME3_PHACE|nr:unnamed protein product [Phaedon cochleariae]
MTETEEDCFPRGGRRVNTTLKRPKEDDNLFSDRVQKKAKKPKKDKRKGPTETLTEEAFHSSLRIQGNLSYNSLRSNMMILGCIRHISNFSLEVELPGLTFGTINITNISDPFTKYLSACLERNDEDTESILTKMFQIGQFIMVKVVNVEHGEKNVLVECTMNPREIYSERSHSDFKKGLLVWASVQSVLDHGYELNVGVKNCRVFLPSKNVDAEQKLAIGVPLWCTIHKCDSSSAATTMRVSCKEQHLKAGKIEEISSLDHLMPGMQVEILIEKITANGIEGKFLNDYFGFIDESQLKTPSKNLENYQEGKLITAFVMYVDHPTKVTHLTMRNMDIVPTPSHKNGEIISGEVISRAHNGVYLKLSSKEKSFVTNRRLINSLGKNPNLDLSETIRSKFDVGTKHTCRILDYNRLSRVYISTVEQSLIREKIFSPSDLKLGQLVNVVVESVKSDGLVVTTGHTRGFVPNLYISNVKYSETIKKKFKEGYKCKARVLSIDENNLLLTLKQSQVEADNALIDINNANRGDKYTGVVVLTRPTGALVTFYGNIKGWISNKFLEDQESQETPDPTQYFYKGQVVNLWVLGVKNDRVILSLKQPGEFRALAEIRVGQKVQGIVGKIYKDRMEVKSKRGKAIGIVPVNHLGSTLSLCPSLLKTYKPGDEINDLICIDTKSTPNILSRREFLALERNSRLRLRKLEKLIPGNIVRCSYISDCESGINVLPLILDHAENILIRKKDIMESGKQMPKFQKYQSIVGKILEIDHEQKKIRLSIKFTDVFDNSVETTLGLFSQHLTELAHLRRFGRENDWPLCQYGPGERISCKIEKLGDQGGCLVKLPNNSNGLVAPRLCPSNIKIGETMTGVFLSEDFKDNFVEICLKKDVSQKINKAQDGRIRIDNLSSCIVENIIIKSYSALVVLKQENGNKQLVYIPMFLHENDFEGCKAYYEKSKLKICICGKVGDYLIGISKKLFLTLDKTKALISKEKALRQEKHSSKLANIDTKNNPNQTSNDSEPEHSENESSSNDSAVELLDDFNSDPGITESEEEAESDSKINTGATIKSKKDETRPAKRKSEIDSETPAKKQSNSDSETSLGFTGITSSFFQPESRTEADTSSDEEDETEVVKKKKKKLSAKERAELARLEEERISKIEKELADLNSTPQSADQFDRLLLANPNSSELWTKYIAFHTAATEFEKAKTVAKRALESIKLTLVDERFNIWLALLNLENMFGTKESFDQIFEEAVRHNDSLQVYLKVVQMLADGGKLLDMEEKAKKCRNKHKQEPTMWLELAKTYYSIGRFKDARNLKDAALKSIQDKKTQLEIIVRFAIMEFRFGEEEQGAAVFETILSSDPRKVNIWTTYVDQLIKKNRIENARRVLERAVSQRLPLKSMRTLFAKFRMFEEQHGSPESLEAVKERAKEFVTKFANKQ